jgi:cytochrome bd-type quinol oxidase subunit 2
VWQLKFHWNVSFAGGSLVATFMQGVMVGALVESLPVVNGRYGGGAFDWLSPFAVLCGVGLCVGYALLCACWLVRKSDGDVREDAYRIIPYLSLALLVFPIVVFMYALGESLPVLNRWIERPYLLIFPFIGVVAAIVLAVSVRRQSGRAALRNGQSYSRGCLLRARDPLLALHDPVRRYDRPSRGPSLQSGLQVLVCRHHRVPADAHLHGN